MYVYVQGDLKEGRPHNGNKNSKHITKYSHSVLTGPTKRQKRVSTLRISKNKHNFGIPRVEFLSSTHLTHIIVYDLKTLFFFTKSSRMQRGSKKPYRYIYIKPVQFAFLYMLYML